MVVYLSRSNIFGLDSLQRATFVMETGDDAWLVSRDGTEFTIRKRDVRRVEVAQHG